MPTKSAKYCVVNSVINFNGMSIQLASKVDHFELRISLILEDMEFQGCMGSSFFELN